MDYGALSPEINSARMYSGPGSAPMLAAASAWSGLAEQLQSTASLYQSVISGLTEEGWLGPASASMAAAVAPYMTWTSVTGAQAEQTATNATAAAGAYEVAYAMTVPPPVVAANRARLMMLVATNFLGQNTPAIAAAEAEYGEMWAQDAAAMYGYAANAAAAADLTSFTEPPQTTNPSGQATQAAAVSQAGNTAAAGGVQQTLNQVTSAIPNAIQSLASPLAAPSSAWDFLDSNFVNGFVSAGYVNPAIIQQTVTASMADINAVALGGEPGATALPPMGAGPGNPTWVPLLTPNAAAELSGAVGQPFGSASLSGVSAGANQAAFVGRLSVPQSWTAVAQVANHAGAASPGGGWTGTALPEGAAGMPGAPGMPVGRAAGYGFGNGPRYGFRPTVMAHPPAAG
jgi:PPE-repeat protein